jgi:hypothetical protein
MYYFRQCQIKASLFTVLNENGQVLTSKIVPSDEGKHIKKTLTKLWETEGRTAVTGHVFTDNSVKGIVVTSLSLSQFISDKNTVLKAWNQCIATKDKPNPSVKQDVWHALHRIDQVMNHKHPGEFF